MVSLKIATLASLLPLLTYASPFQHETTDVRSMRRDIRTGDGVTPLGFELVGDAGISAQMVCPSLFDAPGGKRLCGDVDVFGEQEQGVHSGLSIDGLYGTHPAWAVEYDVNNNTYRTMDVYSNTFCAGGAVLGNGTWIVFGGNQPVTTGGVATTYGAAYDDNDGGTAIRLLNPCEDESCEWIQGTVDYSTTDDTGGWLQMTGRRWYPMVEGLPDGSVIIIGGDKNGGYVNTAAQDNPTYEFWPPKGDGEAVGLSFLSDTLPVNLYALTWLMPSGKLFMQASRSTILYDYNTLETTNLPDMPYATRVYPASAATAMLPLTPANNYTATLLFCGGSNTTQWGNDGSPGYNVTAVPADNTCVRISPDDASPQYEDDDYMLEGRSMGQFVMLPDGTFWMGNGVAMGTAGYGNDGYSIGQSYGQAPLYIPAIYNPSAPAGTRWNRTGLSATPRERMYHSTALLMADGSVFISGSNPNADFTTAQWGSKTSTERWYPWWYQATRPVYSGLPSNISYGGNYFDLTIDNLNDETIVKTAKVVLIRGGWNTHALGMMQKYLELSSSYSIDQNTNITTLHVSQLPGTPGPTLFQPGPAMMFLVVDGIPSIGEFVMVGSGQIGTQPTATNTNLPSSTVLAVVTSTSTTASPTAAAPTGSSNNKTSSAQALAPMISLFSWLLVPLVSFVLFA
ncbi:hypothetical protein P7C73_g3698, partial [Tremellales sp. Uapishka_1]